jgi:hypothetical protein
VKAIVKSVIAFLLVLVALVVIIGPGGVVAGAEYPFGIGPWSSTGRYCHDIYSMSHFVAEFHHSGQTNFNASQRRTFLAFQETLTTSGPQVPRADFTAFFRTTGHVEERTQGEGKLINTWWNQNCTDAVMEVPASVSRVWSGVGSHASFTHYPKDVIQLKNFFTVIR